jgi:hypothetical protein
LKFQIRRGNENDAEEILRLFSEGGNPHGWTVQKWQHYYVDYPEGDTKFFVAESEEGLVGHYGLFPVTIGGMKVFMGAHAYVTESVRGLAVISRLMKSLDEFCIENNVPFIVGFANQKFTIVKTKLFKWKTLFFADFVKTNYHDPSDFRDRPFSFKYSSNWLQWRFGIKKAPVISAYQSKGSVTPVYQLLHAESGVSASVRGIPEFECWSPVGYQKEAKKDIFSQPFSIKIYDKQWAGPDLLKPENWYIQMGDSDTFVFKAI